ncbi:MAG: hypothetical protein A3F91_09365 [Flavobacteria bacterium RIFCSPLOWO2_12_FULL_35_11]|nr:MAG: hypothetical protein A3F91_09365 [Flavobacteria bacterium RIFCSPLOWO2_12_FULL_35_11]
MRDFQNLLSLSKQNYELSRTSGLDVEIVLQTRLDYFRALLLKNNSYNMTKLKNWCIENQDLSFFELANNDVEYLMATNILYSDDGEIFKFFSQEDKDKLYDYQVKFIEKNATLIKLLSHTKDNFLFSSLAVDKEERFEREVLTSKTGIANFLTHSTKFNVNNFSNSITTYLDSVDAGINISLIKSEEEWRNTSYNEDGIAILTGAKPFVALNPVVFDNHIVGYSPINLYDISQTTLGQERFFLTAIPEDIILQRLKASLLSSEAISSVVGGGVLDSQKSLSSAVAVLGRELGSHYLIDGDERAMFLFAFSKSLGLDSDLENIGMHNIKVKLKNVLSTLNLVNNELFLADIYAKNTLTEDLYFKLGKKDAEVLNSSLIEKKISALMGDDRVQYGLGIDISKVKLRGSVDIAKEILEKEDVSISTDYKNLFLVTKKLTINSGNFAGKSFVLEDSLDDNELKTVVAKEFLSKLVEKDMLKNRLNIKRIGDELKRNRELFDGKHTDDIGQLHDKRESSELSGDGDGRNSAEISAAQSRESNGYAQQLDGAGVQRERSVGDSESRDSLYELASEIENQAHEQFAVFVEKIAKTRSKKELTEINYEINSVGFSDYKILEKDYLDLKKIIEAKFDLLIDEEAIAVSLDKDADDLNIVEDENFTVEGDISSGGAKTKFKNYIAGIEILRKIEAGEEISREDKIILSKMPGVGTIAQAFPRSDGSVTKGWENEAVELKETLSDAEYKQAQRATLDAYYTDENIIKAMWSGIERFGFKGGSVLEPSVGVGNFFGYMPKNLKPSTQLLGVELDKTTAKVAQILYPKAKIYNVGFENFQLLGGQKASLVIGNPPYGAHKISDKTNVELDGKNIHNYFMGKGIDSLDEGGVMAMVVSSSFLDSADMSTRAYIGKSANLIGAIRLPKGSFGNANTEVVTDIVFLQKRDLGMESNITDWLNIGEVNETPINQYYEKNQENLLGIWGKFSSMYRGDEPGLIAREGQNTQRLLNEAVDGLPRFINYYAGKYSYSKVAAKESSISSSNSIMWRGYNALAANLAQKSGEKMSSDARINSYFINDEKIYKRLPDINGEAVVKEVTTRTDSKGSEVALSENEIEKIKGMIKIAEVGSKLRGKQLDDSATDLEIENLRSSLNVEYDRFVKEFGYLSRSTNARLFEDDVNAPFLLALEKKYDKGISTAVAKKNGINPVREVASKADIFFKRTQTPYRAPESAKSYEDALSICLGEKTYVNIHYMSILLKKDELEIETYLSDNGFIFDDPNEGWVTRESYLSGNVKEKYSQTQIQRNLEALEDVIPADIPAIDISVTCGAGWIPARDLKDFIREISGYDGDFSCFYTPLNAAWNLGDLRISSKNAEEYGTKRKDVNDILLAALNNRQLTVYDTIGSGSDARKEVNQDETTAANDKVDLVKERWNEWIWESPERRERLGKMYNDKFNVYAKREFDGAHLKLPGKVDDSVIEFRPHQKNGVWRALQSGTVLFDHTVGSGKTFTGVASAMELKRVGKADKPLVVVPKHLVSQWAKEWLELYPNANLLVPTEKDFTPSRRKLLMSRIATGEYDGIIISHSHLGKIENDRDFEIRFIQNQIDEIRDALNALRLEDGKHGMTAKQWQLTQQKLEHKLENLINKSKDDNISFLELGIDAMIIDEFHEFKNLGFHTSLQRLAKGLGNPIGSQKAFDMYIKTQSLLEKTGNKNLIVLTGTPISNSITEMFTLKRYLLGGELKAQGLGHFDAWVKQYADITTDWELTASTQYKLTTRLSKFKNMPELIGAYSTFADVVTIDMVQKQLAKEGKTLDLPAVKGGKPNNVIVERSEEQARFIGVADELGIYDKNSLVYRSENLPKGKPQKGDDNMLVIMGHAKKASLDMRLIDESYGDFEGSKINKSVVDMLDIYKKWDGLNGAQLIFCDLSTPKGAVAGEKARIKELIEAADAGDESAIKELDEISPDDLEALNSKFSVYDDIKSKLILNGIPHDEIAFIHDAKTPLQKEELFAKVNGGRIRFLLGSTSKMGSGMNVQKRLVGEHHLDVPWRPSDLEQREGRIIRQGNLLFSLYKVIKENGYSSATLKDNEKFKAVADELGIKGVSLNKIIADAKEHGGDFEVEINRYATKNTLDSGLWEKIEAKAKFIAQIRSGEIKDREVDDISGEAANAAEMKAAASGNPLVMEEVKLKRDISKLEAVKKNFNRGLYDRETRIDYYKKQLVSFNEMDAHYKADIGNCDAYKKELELDRLELEKLKSDNKSKGISNKNLKNFTGFKIHINSDEYDSREEAGGALLSVAKELLKSGDKFVKVGSFAGFDLSIQNYSAYNDRLMQVVISTASNEYIVSFAIKDQSPGGLCIKLSNRLEEVFIDYEKFLNQNKLILKELPVLEGMGKIFPKEDELQLLKSRYKIVVSELKSTDKNKSVDKAQNIEGFTAVKTNIINDWVDTDSGVDTRDILEKKRIDLSVIEKIDFSIVGKCFVLNNQLDRSDYLKFEKIFELFGGKWDRKVDAVVFSDDGLRRMKDVLALKNRDEKSADIEKYSGSIVDIINVSMSEDDIRDAKSSLGFISETFSERVVSL